MRDRVASQVDAIKHWRVIEGDYTEAPDAEATWFIDPPYNNKAGSHYPWGCDKIDYNALGQWCHQRRGQVIACENEGATWLPFRPFALLGRGLNKPEGSREAITVMPLARVRAHRALRPDTRPKPALATRWRQAA